MTQPKLIDLGSNLYLPAALIVDSLGFEIDPTETSEFKISKTNLVGGKNASVGYCMGRRSLGWQNTSAQGDLSNYLDNTQSGGNSVGLGTTYYLVSSSIQDGINGTGIRSVRLNCLDSSGHISIRTIITNGTTSVNIGNDITYIQYMESSSVGSVGKAVGDITISSSSSSTPTIAQIVEKITADEGRSLSGRMKVPANYTAYAVEWDVFAINGDMDARFRANVFTDDRTISPSFHFHKTLYVALNQSSYIKLPYFKFPSGAEIKMSAKPSAAAASNRCDGSFKYILISNI